MGIYRVAGRSRHIEFLQVQGILSFFYVIRRDDIGTAQDRCIGIVPAIVLGLVQSIADHLLVGAAAGRDIKIVIISFIARIVSGDQR